jgi:dephospho-CoA kinase
MPNARRPTPDASCLKWPPLVVAGLTGGIASGKTTVAGFFRDLGATVMNADDEGRAVVEPGEPALAEIVARFGPEYLKADGSLDRRALGDRIFGGREDRLALNRITHGRIGERLRGQLRALAKRPPNPPVVVIEAAVLIEAGWQTAVDRTIVVVAQHSVQVARLIAGPRLTAAQAEARVRSQLPLRARLRHAHYRVSGEAPLEETKSRVAEIWRELQSLTERGAGKRPIRG